MKNLFAITIFASSVIGQGVQNATTCSDNWDCPNVYTMGCCQGMCIEYGGADKELCADTTNRPLEAPCDVNVQCGDSCCSQTRNICVAPLLDCKKQLPLWAFITAVSTIFVFLGVCWKVADAAEKKTKKRRREKREEENYVDTENNSDRNTKKSAVSGSRVSNRKSPKTEIPEQKLGAMQRDNRKSAHFANPNENKEKLLDPNNNY